MIRLRITAGPAAGQELETAGEVVFGRAEAGLGALGGDPDVSRRHARITPGPAGGWTVDDLGSTNGTYVNGQRLGQPIPLKAGDTVQMGQSRIAIQSVGAQATAATPVQPAPASAPAATGLRASALEVIGGPAQGQQLAAGGTLVVGRTETGLGGDDLLSRRHAKFTRTAGGSMVVEDLGSTNGTFVNEHRIDRPALLSPGDVVAVGSSRLRVVGAAAPVVPAVPPPPPPPPAPAAVAALAAIPGAGPLQGSVGGRMKRRTIIAVFSVIFLVLVGVAVAVTVLKTPGKPGPECHQGLCGPAGVVPLRSGTDYVNARFGYRLTYPGNLFTVAGDDRGITLTATPHLRSLLGISGEMIIRVQGAAASEAVPQQWLETQRAALAGNSAGGLIGNTDPKFAVLGAEIGYHQGTGVTWSGNAASPGGGAGSNVMVFGEAATDGKVTIAATVLIDEPDFQRLIGALQVPDSLINSIRFAGDTA